MQSLVNYSSSEEEFDDKLDQKKAQEQTMKRKLPLPDSFITKCLKVDEEHDSPELHEGRSRTIKHERGNWATFIYIEMNVIQDLFEEIQQVILGICKEKLNLTLKCLDDFHISLTKLLILKHHWIDSFIESIKAEIENLPSFSVSLAEIEVYCNEEKTRTFIGIKSPERHKLIDMVSKIDRCLSEFKLPVYYENPSFHTSVLWILGDQTNQLNAIKSELQSALDEILQNEEVRTVFFVSEIFCKCGDRKYKFNLK